MKKLFDEEDEVLESKEIKDDISNLYTELLVNKCSKVATKNLKFGEFVEDHLSKLD